jgi:hypothetical protein
MPVAADGRRSSWYTCVVVVVAGVLASPSHAQGSCQTLPFSWDLDLVSGPESILLPRGPYPVPVVPANMTGDETHLQIHFDGDAIDVFPS